MLSEAEQKFRSLVEGCGTAVAISDLKGKLTYVNQALAELLGYSIDELMGRSFKDFIHPQDKKKIFSLFLNIIPLRRHPRELELRVVRRDGGTRHIWTKPTRYKLNGRLVGFHTIIVDITEKKVIEERLWKSQESLIEAQRIAHLGNWDWNIEADEVYWSDEIYRIFGFTPQKFVVTYEAFLSCVHPDDRALVKDSIEKALSGEEPYSIDHRILLPDGSERIVHEQGEVFFANDRQPMRMIGTVQDITAKKRLEEELNEAKLFMETIIENLPEPVYIKDRNLRYVLVNKAYCEFNGRAKGDVIGKTDYDLQPQEEADLFKKQDMRVFETSEILDIAEQIETDVTGNRHIMHCRMAPLRDEKENICFLVGIEEDITQRKRMEMITRIREKLRRSPDISSGLNLLLNRVIDDYQMDIGAVLLVDHDAKSIQVRGFKSKVKGNHVAERFPFDTEYIEVQSYLSKKGLSAIVGENNKSIFSMTSIHSAPINFGQKKYGMLCLGNRKEQVLSDSDLSGLSLYAELVSTLFELQSIQVVPVKEIDKVVDRRFKLESSNSYLILNNVEKSFEVFVDSVLSGVEGLCVTRTFPPKIREKYGLEKTPILWLSEEKVEGEKTIYSLQDISILLSEFLDKAKESIVLLDGFEYLITNHGFDSFLHFLQITRNRFEQNGSIFLAPLFSEALDHKEVKLIERELQKLSTNIVAKV